jgi:hypothetical protein
VIDLDPGTLDPVWWPWVVRDELRRPRELTAAQRHADFSVNFDDTHRAIKKASAAEPNSKPHLVLRALLRLRAR